MPNLVQIMVKVIMNFEVEDWDRWHTAFLANSKMREENHGETDESELQALVSRLQTNILIIGSG